MFPAGNSFGASTARIATSLATDPIGNAITEFVPDLARHVNVQVVIVQRIINRVAIAEGGSLRNNPKVARNPDRYR